ncbi:MAG: hypothetical protein OXF90_12440, partial [Chloroflexi bacterium]|nr:hypothetical protein [Chloroflexota bacterium]
TVGGAGAAVGTIFGVLTAAILVTFLGEVSVVGAMVVSVILAIIGALLSSISGGEAGVGIVVGGVVGALLGALLGSGGRKPSNVEESA